MGPEPQDAPCPASLHTWRAVNVLRSSHGQDRASWKVPGTSMSGGGLSFRLSQGGTTGLPWLPCSVREPQPWPSLSSLTGNTVFLRIGP